MTLLVLLAMPLPDGDTNVALDDERLQDNVPKGLQKVELDLDDALFLEFEEKEEEPPPPAPEAEPEPETAALVPQEKTPSVFARKKFLVLGIAAALCLILGAGGAYFFLKSGFEETPAPEQAEHAAQTEDAPREQAATPAREATEAPAMPPALVTHTLEKFQVEYVVANQIRFLSCSLSIPGITEIMRLEMQAKSVFIRDGIYRYLKNAPLSFLDNPDNSDKLKNDLAAVINQHLKSGSVSQIMIEEYVVR